MGFQTISVKRSCKQYKCKLTDVFASVSDHMCGSRYESEKYICKLFDSILKVIQWHSYCVEHDKKFLTESL